MMIGIAVAKLILRAGRAANRHHTAKAAPAPARSRRSGDLASESWARRRRHLSPVQVRTEQLGGESQGVG